MSILVTVVLALIALCCVALAFYLIEWVLGALGIGFPPMVVTVLKIILVLVAILILVRLFGPMIGDLDLGLGRGRVIPR